MACLPPGADSSCTMLQRLSGLWRATVGARDGVNRALFCTARHPYLAVAVGTAKACAAFALLLQSASSVACLPVQPRGPAWQQQGMQTTWRARWVCAGSRHNGPQPCCSLSQARGRMGCMCAVLFCAELCALCLQTLLLTCSRLILTPRHPAACGCYAGWPLGQHQKGCSSSRRHAVAVLQARAAGAVRRGRQAAVEQLQRQRCAAAPGAAAARGCWKLGSSRLQASRWVVWCCCCSACDVGRIVHDQGMEAQTAAPGVLLHTARHVVAAASCCGTGTSESAAVCRMHCTTSNPSHFTAASGCPLFACLYVGSITALAAVGSSIWVGDQQGRIWVLDSATATVQRSWQAHVFPVRSIAAAGHLVCSLGKDGGIWAWPAVAPPAELTAAWRADTNDCLQQQTLQVLACTWNVNENKPSRAGLEQWLGERVRDAQLVLIGLQVGWCCKTTLAGGKQHRLLSSLQRTRLGGVQMIGWSVCRPLCNVGCYAQCLGAGGLWAQPSLCLLH